ncbi:hypothetical protein M413DRAFT_31341 [Hebeloma cylindrosporum]|uniref:Uncharacterized protein n=1 Tax=Hebeloma cylindrosporum TaxID=76867 RepID=A0A0C2Y7E0_HEBCY|nr:hypothetical protein M413DRAFT_31341 [Hebeloma cylindrosporum h7]
MNQNHDPVIHRLPPEIISHIFFHYSRVNKSFTTSAKTNTLFLGAVCRSWRQLAWATPELWNSFFIGYGIVSRWSESAHAEKLFSEWLERSAALPLTIQILDMNRRWGDEVYRAMTDVLNKHSARWYDMDLAISERHLHLFSGIALEKKSILRRLVLSTKLTRSEAALVRFKMNCSPIELKLASLSLEYVDILWDNLTVVHLSSLPVDEFFEVLQRCPNITTITLQKITRPSGTFIVPNTRIPCPRVLSFELSNIIDKVVLSQVLDLVKFPSLDQWSISTCAFPQRNMISFIEASSFTLKTFQIVGDRRISDRIHNLLRHFPSLETLHLRFWFHDNLPTDSKVPFFSKLCSTTETDFLPRLQTLKFGYDLAFPLHALPKLFTTGHRRSLEVEINYEGPLTIIGDGIAERLLELVDKGFRVKVLCNGKADILEEYRVKQRSHKER